MGQKFIITEEERNSIEQMYNLNITEDYTFEMPHITIDGRFLIYKDELYDYNLNENFGYIFSVKNLKHLFENTLTNKENYCLIQEVKHVLNNSIINEQKLKDSIKNNNLITEQNAFAENIVGKGVLYIARGIKKALWSLGGMAVDAFLVASGIGKTVQWIPWAICFMLDVYEWSMNDYENEEDKNSSPIWKALNIGFDIMGMMVAGPVAKLAQKMFKPIQFVTSEVKIAKIISKSPKASSFIKTLSESLGGVSGKITELVKYLSVKTPKLASWVSGLMSKISSILNWLGSMLKKIITLPGKTAEKIGTTIQGGKLTGKTVGGGLKSATNATGVYLGVEKGLELSTGVSKVQTQNMQDYENIIKTKYKGQDPFDL